MNRTRIWIPESTPKIKSSQSVSFELPLKFGLQGIFTAELLNRSGNVIDTWTFPNVITNAFMDGIGSGTFGVSGIAGSTAALQRLRAGTGSAIPSGTDNNLQAPIGNFVTVNGGFTDVFGFVSGSEPSGNYHFLQRSRLFDFADASGNITELAWYTNSSTTALVRTLIRDEFGVPTSISKTTDEQLRVRYELRMIVPITTSSFTLTVGSTIHSATVYPNNVDNILTNLNTSWGFQFTQFGGNKWTNNGSQIHMVAYSSYSFAGGAWNAFTPINVFNRANNDIKSASAYTNGTFFRDTSHSFAATNTTVNAYPSGIFAVGVANAVNTSPSDIYNFNYPWIITFNPPIPKSDIQRLDLFVRWRWARSGTESL